MWWAGGRETGKEVRAFKRRCKLNQHAYPFDTISQITPRYKRTSAKRVGRGKIKGNCTWDSIPKGVEVASRGQSGQMERENTAHIANDQKNTKKITAKCNETLGATCHFVCVYERVDCLYTSMCANLVKNWSADMPTGKWIKQKK